MSNDAHWAQLRKRQRLCWVLLAAFIPVSVVVGLPLSIIFASTKPLVVVAAAWMLTLLIASNRVVSWPCPRCGKPFVSTRWSYNTFARKCRHCQLPKWSAEAAR